VFIFGVCWCLVSVWHILLLRTGRKFDSGIFVLNIYFCVPYVFVLILILSSFNNFPFISCFSNSGWAVGPSGGIVEPDLVTRMRLDESADGHLSYGPSLSLFREPFANERYLFGDSQYHNCRPYLDMEKEFFSNNAAIVREVYFDTDILLGADSDEDVGVEEAVNAEDLVPVLSAEEIEWQHAAANDIMNMVIVRVTPVNSDSEDEETMERVASPVVVEAVRDVTDSDEATGSADSVVNNSPDLVIAGEGEETMERVASPVVVEAVAWTISCLGLRVVPLCSLLSLTGDEVSLYFLFSYPAL